MKKFFTLLVAVGFCNLGWSAILTVSNNSTYPAQYSVIQTAINAAAAGDTIYIYPSATLYAEWPITITKRLVMIGAGINPQRPSRLSSTVSGFMLSGTAASGTVIIGITFTAGIQSGSDAVFVNNVVVSECQLVGVDGLNYFHGNNIRVENCILTSPYSTGGHIIFNSTGAACIIQNNYLHGGVRLYAGTQALIRNNIFASGDANTIALREYGGAYSSGVQVWNNIFYKANPGLPVAAACEFKNNIYYLTSNPVPSNGLSSGNINANPLFVNYPAAGNFFSLSYNFHLDTGSPGINYGTDGTDVGIWGGATPVNAGYEPPIPRIYELNVNNATVPVGGTIQLTIKATKAQ